jgi:hypothetical protein
MTVARILKRCDCPEGQWDGCPHQWVVRYRTTGGRSSRQREQSFGDDLREAEDFALKVEHDKRAHVFVDPKAGRVLFRDAAGTWLDQHLGADSSIATYRSVLRAHIAPAIGGKPIGAIRREDIKALIAAMHRKGLSASRIGCAYLVISAVLSEAVRDKKLAESPCTGIHLPGVVTAADFILPAHAQVEAVAAGLPPDWAATIWLMHGCGLRIGEALAVNLRCRVNRGKTLRVREQVNPTAQLKPLKFRREEGFRDIPHPPQLPARLPTGRRESGTPAGVHPALAAPPVRLDRPGRGHPDHRGVPLARPQQHRGHPPDLRPPHPLLLRPRPHRPRYRLPEEPQSADAEGRTPRLTPRDEGAAARAKPGTLTPAQPKPPG